MVLSVENAVDAGSVEPAALLLAHAFGLKDLLREGLSLEQPCLGFLSSID